MGLFFGVFWWYVADAFDRLILSIPHVGLLILFVSALVLMLNPQPRPMTPTFLQNCLLIGLLSGSAIGFRMEMDRSRQTAATVATPDVENHGRNIFLRILIGYTAVLVARQILKVLLTTLLRCIGVDPSPNKTKKQKNDERNKNSLASPLQGPSSMRVSVRLSQSVRTETPSVARHQQQNESPNAERPRMLGPTCRSDPRVI